jgi:membrane-associated phospholipid phosphatase
MNSAERENCRGNEAVLALRVSVGAQGGAEHAARNKAGEKRGAALVTREAAEVWAACGAFEWIALGYLAVSCALIAVFAENLTHPVRLIGVQLFVAAVILILCRAEARAAKRGVWNHDAQRGTDQNVCPAVLQGFWHFWRHWYPHLFFLFCFEEMAKLVHLFSPGWEDAKLMAFDHWLTGVSPSLWLEHFAHPGLNEFMQFAYFTYFAYLLILGGVLYYRCDWKSYWAVMTYSAIGYVLGYIIAMFFPVESPWFSMAGMWHSELVGGPFTGLINFIEKCGRVHGAAFPSQHVAGAMAALWGAWRHRRWIFWTFLPFVMCMCVSTVYVRNHYMADVFGGMVTGTLGYVIGVWLMKTRGAVGEEV